MRKTIVHFRFSQVFNLTENWMYNQFIHFSDRFRQVFYSKKQVNSDIFPAENLRIMERYGYLTHQLNRVYRKFTKRELLINRWLSEDKPALVHAHFGKDACVILNHLKKCKRHIPLVTSFYGWDAYVVPREEEWRKRYRELFGWGSLFLAEGPVMGEKLKELGCPPEKIRVHRIGIGMDKYPFVEREFNREQTVKLLMVGRFVEKKGFPCAVETVHLLVKMGYDVILTLVGDSDSQGTLTDEKRNILETIGKYNLQQRVRLVGYKQREELDRIAREHHILLTPSVFAADGDAEGGHPVFLTEMAAAGMPMAAFDHCDIKEIVVNDKTGVLVPMKDVRALAHGIGRMIDNPALTGEMSRNLRERVKNRYDLISRNLELEKIYETLINHGKL